MRNWLKTLLFVSSFSPTLLVLGVVRYYSSGELDTLTIQLAIIAILGTLIPFLILLWVRSETETIKFKAKKVESADYFLIVFVASYLTPVVIKMAEVDALSTGLAVAVVFSVAWVVSSIPSHPLLYLVKYRFYKVESDDGMVYVLITKNNIKSPANIKFVRKISHSMLME